jgi:hypothetical protein
MCNQGLNRYVAALMLAGLLPLMGCGNPAEQAVKKLYKPSLDKDVTTSATYNFAPFAGTVWKTKVKTAIAEVKRYTGAMDISLLASLRFDPADPRYTPIRDMKIIAELPVGTRVRITRLMQDQGAGGNVEVEAMVQDGTNTERAVYVDQALLAPPAWTRGPGATSTWDANFDMLEPAKCLIPHALDAAMCSLFHTNDHWRRASDVYRSPKV